MEKRRGDMDLDLVRKLIEEMVDHAPLQIVPFFRGESLLHPLWYPILELIKKRGVGEIQFTTNATRLGENEAKRLLELDIDFISFSMDTLIPDLYNRIRRGSDYSRCVTNVLRFLELRDAMGAKTQIQISAVETEDTKAGMDDFVSFWQTKADRVRVYVEHSGDGNIISEPVLPGCVQVPSGGEPIVLMADCGTVGGYPKIATVISVDLGLLAQFAPGTEFIFDEVSVEESQGLLREQERLITELADSALKI